MSFSRGARKGFALFGENITVIVNSILLTFVYIVGVGLTALVAKLYGKHFLDTEKKASYWHTLNLKKQPLKNYHRQF